jgi:hypothetical protein
VLKASIIYYPGSGGSFLFRVLTLSEKTIMGSGGEHVTEHSDFFTKTQRLERYLNWGGYNNEWKKNEGLARLTYKTGLSQFVDYEDSVLWLIDKLHPTEFAFYESQNLWQSDNTFEKFIFIEVDSDDIDFLLANQKTKSYNLNFEKEQCLYQQLSSRFDKNKYSLKFKSLFDESLFLQEIQNINRWLNLELDFELVKILWNKWFLESKVIWKI